MNRLQRWMATTGLALGLLSLAGAPAPAAKKVEDSRLSFSFVRPGVDNTCTPGFDDITPTATGHAFNEVWTADDGSSRAQNHLGIHLAGEAADGTGYVGTDQFKSLTRIEDGVVFMTADTRHRLASQGSAPNFDLRFKLQASFDLAGTFSTFEVLEDHAKCRG